MGLRLGDGELVAVLQDVLFGEHENRNLQGALPGRCGPGVRHLTATPERYRELALWDDVPGHHSTPGKG